MSSKGSRSKLVMAIMLMIVTACSGGGESSSTIVASSGDDQASGTTADRDQDPAPEQAEVDDQRGQGLPAGGAEGSFTVDGETFEASVYRCEPFSASGPANPEDLDLRAFFSLSHGVELEIAHSTRPGSSGRAFEATILFVFYSRPSADGPVQFEGAASTDADGVWYPGNLIDLATATPLEQPAFEISGDRIKGGLTNVEQSWPEGGGATVDITFDLEVPNDFLDGC